MTYEQECVADVVFAVMTATSFGIWQGSVFAGIFMFLMIALWKGEKA